MLHSSEPKKAEPRGGRGVRPRLFPGDCLLPWTASDAKGHIKGLTAHQAQVWANVANSALKGYLADGGKQDDCDGCAAGENAPPVRGY